MIKNRLKSLGYALRGIRYVFKEETNFGLIVLSSFVAVGVAYLYNFSAIEFSIVIILITLVAVAEMVNTAIEDLCDKIEPNHDHAIGKIKDISSGFVLLASFGSGVVGLILFFSHYLK